MKIDYYHEYPIDQSTKQAVMEVLDGHVHNGGKYTKQLEAGIASICGVAHGTSANAGTSALLMTLQAFGIGPGDKVSSPLTATSPTPSASSIAARTPSSWIANTTPRA